MTDKPIYDTQLQGLTIGAMNIVPDIVLHGLRITPKGIIYNGQELQHAGEVHAALLDVLNGRRQLPAQLDTPAVMAKMSAQALACTSREQVQFVLDGLAKMADSRSNPPVEGGPHLSIADCIEQFRMYARINPSPDAQHALVFAADFLRDHGPVALGADVPTWKERLGDKIPAAATAAGMFETAMQAEIDDLRARLAPDCGACPGDGTICAMSCRHADENPMDGTAQLIAAGALRQLRHNDGAPGLVFAYDKDVTDRVLATLDLSPKPAYIEQDDDAPLRDQLARAISDEIRAGADEPDWNDSREVDRLAEAALKVLQALGADTNTEAAKLAPILRGMCEGGPVDGHVDIYAVGFSAADGDVYVQRAAQLVLEQAGLIAQLQRKNGFILQLNGKQGGMLRTIRAAITDYYAALNQRQNGAIAIDRAFRAIENEMGMAWDQGAHAAEAQPVKDGPARPVQD
jgi:hypothetical protein